MKHLLSVLAFVFFLSVASLVQADTKVYFSPNGGCQEIVVSQISRARHSIEIAMYAITSREIAQAIVKAKDRGIKVRVVLDKSQIKEITSKSRYLIKKDVNVKFHIGPGLMHDKFAIVDDRAVLTGSFNWTAAADKKNAENLLLITDKEIAMKFVKQFKHLWSQSGEGAFNEHSDENKDRE